MKLKNISLLYPIKAPWSANYSEFLDPREGYEIIATGGWMRIMHHGRTVMVVNDCMVRCAEVVDEPMVERQRIDSAGVAAIGCSRVGAANGDRDRLRFGPDGGRVGIL